MAFRIRAVIAISLLFASTFTYANPSHSYMSCAVISSEHLTALQLYQRGIRLDDALEYLPKISREGKKRLSYIYDLAAEQGLLNTYADINTNFARCSKSVHERLGAPAIDLREHGYYYCSGENKLRFEIILNIDKHRRIESVLEKTPKSHHSVAQEYSQLISREGILAALDLTANNLKACLSNLNPR